MKNELSSGIESDSILSPPVDTQDVTPDGYQSPELNQGIEYIGMDSSPAPRLSGDVTKNDGALIDALFEPNPEGYWFGDDGGALHGSKQCATPTNHMVTMTHQISPGAWSPTQVLPPDPSRIRVKIRVTGTTATDVIWFGEEPSFLAKATDSANIPFTAGVIDQGNPVVLEGYTGAIAIVAPASNAAVVTVSIIAVCQ